jgi:hypothetical protein
MALQLCKRCGLDKDADNDFYHTNSFCIECSREIVKLYAKLREEDPERYKELKRISRLKYKKNHPEARKRYKENLRRRKLALKEQQEVEHVD